MTLYKINIQLRQLARALQGSTSNDHCDLFYSFNVDKYLQLFFFSSGVGWQHLTVKKNIPADLIPCTHSRFTHKASLYY
jgi:hypothetical protein